MLQYLSKGNLETASDFKAISQHWQAMESFDQKFFSKTFDALAFPEGNEADSPPLDDEAKTGIMQQLVVPQARVMDGNAALLTRYSAPVSTSEAFKPLIVSWDALKEKIGDQPESVAFNFIHRYKNGWFVTAREMKLPGTLTTGNNHDLTREDSLFDITTSGIAITDSGDITSNPDAVNYSADEYGEDYRQNVNTGSAHRTNSVILPAIEIMLLVKHNQPVGVEDKDMQVRFMPVLYDAVTPAGVHHEAHGIILYTHYNGTDLLSDAAVAGAMFTQRGGDYDTLCPPSVNQYYWPASLPTSL